ncbi:perq amino acid with gyf domain 1 [Stylonychia lemnae]|uniref:Perq amino acid with gyf domain 1 n=1 Tax=Stylonychia lemnae TaxID=5949 RepID=A0A078AK84_STYLE|nr:perq amino acid with gyf domain 1 [Stylonychia lemnae]|eukprot:CDW82790.1 perq amino acid with gyf domain 1 [Stylonychia lemnae]
MHSMICQNEELLTIIEKNSGLNNIKALLSYQALEPESFKNSGLDMRGVQSSYSSAGGGGQGGNQGNVQSQRRESFTKQDNYGGQSQSQYQNKNENYSNSNRQSPSRKQGNYGGYNGQNSLKSNNSRQYDDNSGQYKNKDYDQRQQQFQKKQGDETQDDSFKSLRYQDPKRPQYQNQYQNNQDGMWDDDFSKKKFQLGRIIERDMPLIQKELEKLRLGETAQSIKERQNRQDNQDRGRVVRTTNVDYFLNCENMDLGDPGQQQDTPIEEEEDPLWDDIDVEEIKVESSQLPIKKPSPKSSEKELISPQTIVEQDEAIISIKPKEQIPQQQVSSQQHLSQQMNQQLLGQQKMLSQLSPQEQELLFLQDLMQRMNPNQDIATLTQNNQAYQQLLIQEQINQKFMGGNSSPLSNMTLTSVNQGQFMQKQNVNYQFNNEFQQPFSQQILRVQGANSQGIKDPLNLYQQTNLSHQDLGGLQQFQGTQVAAMIQNPFAVGQGISFLMSRSPNQQQDGKWFYKDPLGNVRGPFTYQQMATWYDLGYFSDDLEIAYGENSMFLPLRKYKQITFSNQSQQLPLQQQQLQSQTNITLPNQQINTSGGNGNQPTYTTLPLHQQKYLNPAMNQISHPISNNQFQDIQSQFLLEGQQQMYDPLQFMGSSLSVGSNFQQFIAPQNQFSLSSQQLNMMQMGSSTQMPNLQMQQPNQQLMNQLSQTSLPQQQQQLNQTLQQQSNQPKFQ